MSERKEGVEYLEDLLNAKDEELRRLRAELEELKDRESYRWTRHRVKYGPKAEDDAPGLPVPRLQLKYTLLTPDGYSHRVVYELVYRHYLEGLGNGECLVYVPMGETVVRGGGGPQDSEGKLHLPMRDRCHIASDGRQLKLPMFAVYGDHVEELSTETILGAKR